MLALGFLHGLGADHLMAIAALSLATPLGPARYGRAFWLAVRFAVGHALLLSVGAAAVLFFGWQIPVRFEQTGEFVGGCLLILMGLVGGWLAFTGPRLRARACPHTMNAHGEHAFFHSHWHLHVGRQHSHRPAVHTALPGVMGAVFAVSGLRALILSLPLWNAGTPVRHAALPGHALRARHPRVDVAVRHRAGAHARHAKRMTRQVARFAAAATAARLARPRAVLDSVAIPFELRTQKAHGGSFFEKQIPLSSASSVSVNLLY